MPKAGELTPIKHGTYGGAQAHRKRGIPQCESCKDARNKYETNLRRQRKKEADGRKEQLLIRGRALARLSRMFPEEYKAALGIELAKRVEEFKLEKEQARAKASAAKRAAKVDK